MMEHKKYTIFMFVSVREVLAQIYIYKNNI